eukprot:CAMPEP_0172389380 /NCGR_PEP_ID=MMETSP1061-20121228/6281_1 /TAXON_ID=37318 /ORGANISM="Pseudo-nitzschia pungens, Strain cf. pungens" /LENGTH=36 /DNA_ID= /DNA_START= /DNA_END= /DNA_ORIENTATION=
MKNQLGQKLDDWSSDLQAKRLPPRGGTMSSRKRHTC